LRWPFSIIVSSWSEAPEAFQAWLEKRPDLYHEVRRTRQIQAIRGGRSQSSRRQPTAQQGAPGGLREVIVCRVGEDADDLLAR